MARINNAINFGTGFNITAASPIDSRMLVENITDLTDPNQWYKNSTAPCPVFTGMIVAVKETGSIYTLKKVLTDTGEEMDAGEAHRSILNWLEVGKESYTTDTHQEAREYPKRSVGNLIWVNKDSLDESGEILEQKGLHVITEISTTTNEEGRVFYNNTILRLVTKKEIDEIFLDINNRLEALMETDVRLEKEIVRLSGLFEWKTDNN